MPRPTIPRITAALLALTFIISIIYINSASLRTLHGTNGNPSPHPGSHGTDQIPTLSPAQQNIKAFWSIWAKNLHNGRPHIPPIEIGNPASTVSGQKLPYPRKPGSSYLHLSEHDVTSLTDSHRAFMRALAKAKPDLAVTARELYTGTGVVFVSGGEFYGPALIGLRMLRRTGCTLPAEVFLGTKDEYEPMLCRTVLPALNARCVVMPSFLAPPLSPNVTHYQLKSLALLFTRFQRVLYLDSDSIPLLDPTPMFSAEPFADTGLVLWPDFWTATEDPVFYKISGVGAFPGNLPPTSSEAGEILVDKRRHLPTLLLAAYYNVFGPGYYYELLSQGALGQGDKETFLAATVVVQNKWAHVHKGVEAVGYRRSDGSNKGSGMVQFHPGDDLEAQKSPREGGKREEKAEESKQKKIRPAFIHANTPKMNAGHLVEEGDLFDNGKRVRLWGAKEDAVKRFGEDIERVVWKELVDVGCKFEDTVREWKGKKVCRRLKQHWNAVFAKDGL